MILFHTETYEPQEPEDSHVATQYVSRKDIRVIAIATIGFFGLLTPVYFQMKAYRDKHLCLQNLKSIHDAIALYATQNDDRYPPAFAQLTPEKPLLQNGKAFTWASLVQPYMNPRASFTCPAATKEEQSWSQVPGNPAGMPVTYGMYTVYSGYSSALISSLGDAVIVAETTNGGARNTYDPAPLLTVDGRAANNDAFLVGFPNSNSEYHDDPKTVTRLAFYDTTDGKFLDSGQSRHAGGIFLLTAAGNVIERKPGVAEIRMLGVQPTGYWAVPPEMR